MSRPSGTKKTEMEIKFRKINGKLVESDANLQIKPKFLTNKFLIERFGLKNVLGNS